MNFQHINSIHKTTAGLLLAAALVTCTDPLPVQAASATKNLNMSVLVPAKVQLSASPMDFGDSFNAQNTLTSSAIITVNILAGHNYNISLDGGLHKLGKRRMSNGTGGFRNYLLYKDVTYTTPWGDSDFAATYAAGSSRAATGTGATQLFNVYGRTPGVTGGQASGNYSDAVTVTINY